MLICLARTRLPSIKLGPLTLHPHFQHPSLVLPALAVINIERIALARALPALASHQSGPHHPCSFVAPSLPASLAHRAGLGLLICTHRMHPICAVIRACACSGWPPTLVDPLVSSQWYVPALIEAHALSLAILPLSTGSNRQPYLLCRRWQQCRAMNDLLGHSWRDSLLC